MSRGIGAFLGELLYINGRKESTTGVAENKELVRRWFEEAHNGDLSVVDEVLAPEHVQVSTGLERHERKVSSQTHKKNIQNINSAWTDGRYSVDQIIGEGDIVAVAVTFSGIHTSQWYDYSPTRKKGRITMHYFVRIADGKIVQLWHPSGEGLYRHAMYAGTLHQEQKSS